MNRRNFMRQFGITLAAMQFAPVSLITKLRAQRMPKVTGASDGFKELIHPTMALKGSNETRVRSMALDAGPLGGKSLYAGNTIEILTGPAAGNRRIIKAHSRREFFPAAPFSAPVNQGDMYRVIEPGETVSVEHQGPLQIYVNGMTGSDDNPGTIDRPFKSLQRAYSEVPDDIDRPVVMWIGPSPPDGYTCPIIAKRGWTVRVYMIGEAIGDMPKPVVNYSENGILSNRFYCANLHFKREEG